jgi:hypothetical protein
VLTRWNNKTIAYGFSTLAFGEKITDAFQHEQLAGEGV